MCSNQHIKEELQTKFRPNYPSARDCVSCEPNGNILCHTVVRQQHDNTGRHCVLHFQTPLNKSHAQLQIH